MERDLSDVHGIDTSTWTYVRMRPAGATLPPRSGHTAHLLPCDGGVALM